MSLRDRAGALATPRAISLVAVAALLGASLQVLYHLIDVTGTPWVYLVVVAVTLLFATALSRVLGPRLAVVIGAVLLGAGLAWYLTRISGVPPLESLVTDAIALFFGRSLLQINGINAWVLGVAPAPIFLTWYFAMRHSYVGAVVVAGGTLGFFVLTTDADAVTTLWGVIAATAAVAIGDMDRREEPIVRAETVLTVLALMIVIPALISVVPAGAGASVSITEELLGEDPTLESSLIADDRIDIQGAIELSPKVRFSIRSEEQRYWRVASYDRYSGQGWVRTGTPDRFNGTLPPPEGPARTVRQTVRAETEIGRMPAAWKPVEVTGFNGTTRAAADGSIQPGVALTDGDQYSVRSQVSASEPAALQEAGQAYPERIETTYTQLPASTPDRVTERTDVLTANAETPYETALTVEQWLQNNREYSLSIRKPRGDIADAFLFEMERGYCTYYATTMVTMLRSQGVPARFVTGYRSGERVSEDEWVVRGLNAHAWVEVYFPGHGWQRFDPTPAGPREQARTGSIEQARESDDDLVDTNETRDRIGDGEWTPPGGTAEPLTATPAGTGNGTNGTAPEVGPGQDPQRVPGSENATFGAGEAAGSPLRTPTRQQFTLGFVAIVGLAIGVRHTRPVRRAYRSVWLRYQPRESPAEDVERAFQRVLATVEAETERERSPAESTRAYFAAVDAPEDAVRVRRLRERARYGAEATEDAADEAVRLANRLTR